MEVFNQKNIFIPDLGVIKAETFSTIYPHVNHFICGKEFQKSRGGDVKEILDVKTHITNPYRRCVGGYHRNPNIFFLLAEAMWIACGKKDVKFLTIWNKKMAEFSDDGEIFHAPYGYRLRHWGVPSENRVIDGVRGANGYDQVVDAIRILSENPNSRQVVMEIWNPLFDLGFKTKDIPCNDIIMFKIRDGKLITTIGNRSNDLHLGLPTNIFQFSFLTEIIAGCLGIELGTQTHNSQSLHVYSWNKSAKDMEESLSTQNSGDMYEDYGACERRIDFNFKNEVPVNRFREVECIMNIIIDNLTRIAEGGQEDSDEILQVAEFSSYFTHVYQMLKIFLDYKAKLRTAENDEQKDAARMTAISDIEFLEMNFNNVEGNPCSDFRWDIAMLAKNYFHSRFSTSVEHEFLGKL